MSIQNPKSKIKNHPKAGVVAYRYNNTNDVEILLITARKYPESWIFPVGSVKPGETLQEAAARECLEESGYQVEVGPQVAVVEVEENGVVRRFTFFLARMIGEIETYETDRQRKWVPRTELVDQVAAVFTPVASAVMATRFL